MPYALSVPFSSFSWAVLSRARRSASSFACCSFTRRCCSSFSRLRSSAIIFLHNLRFWYIFFFFSSSSRVEARSSSSIRTECSIKAFSTFSVSYLFPSLALSIADIKPKITKAKNGKAKPSETRLMLSFISNTDACERISLIIPVIRVTAK